MNTPPTPMFLIAAANAFVGLDLAHVGSMGTAGAADTADTTDTTDTGDRPGVHDCFLREVQATLGDGLRPTWDAAFAHHVGFWSHYDHRVSLSSWPLPPVATAAALGDFAHGHHLLRCKPAQGDLFLIWNRARGMFVRTGIVVTVEYDRRYLGDPTACDCVVIEGDTNPARAFRGGLVLRHQRTFSAARGDRFVRWTSVRRVFEAPRRCAA